MNFDLEPKLSFGEINGIALDNYNLEHSCSTDVGSSGCPIFNSNNYKIIGIHLGKYKNRTYKKGTALKIPISKFNNIYNNYDNIIDKNNNNDNYDNYDNINYQNENLISCDKIIKHNEQVKKEEKDKINKFYYIDNTLTKNNNYSEFFKFL